MSFMISFMRANNLIELVACCLLTVKLEWAVLCSKGTTKQNHERTVELRMTRLVK